MNDYGNNISEANISRESSCAETSAGPKKAGFFSRLSAGLSKTRNSILGGVDSVLKPFAKIDEELYEELEETLIMSDFGVTAATRIISELRQEVKNNRISDAGEARKALASIISGILSDGSDIGDLPSPSVILVVGVNGVGKTTTIGKLAAKYAGEGKRVFVAAADTFRAAATEQLEIWANRAGVQLIKQGDGADPGAVVFDAINSARSKKADILICDTAGRLHNKKNLMDELGKINKIIEGRFPEAHKETFIVLDATAGQNSLQQVKTFMEFCDISGIVLTKLDGTAKGGVVAAIRAELPVPVRYIGVGEGITDLQPFDPDSFVSAVFDYEANDE